VQESRRKGREVFGKEYEAGGGTVIRMAGSRTASGTTGGDDTHNIDVQ
jgi:hypothetical protein